MLGLFAYLFIFVVDAELQEPTGKTEAESDTLSRQADTTLRDESVYEHTVPPAKVLQMMAEVEWFRSERAEDISDLAGEAPERIAEKPCVDKTGEKSATSPPYMQVPLEDVQVRCGEMAKFHAIIEGNPQPVVGWFKGISLLLGSERIYQFNKGTSYSLILYNTRAEDGGVYTCMAKNMGGEVLCKAELVVQEDKKSQEAKKRSPRRKLHSFYEVKQEIGRGSFSILKKVIHKGNRVPCAAKFIPLRSRSREQAYRERDILVQLSHDRITQLLDQFETRKTLILILELCSNEELLDRLYKKNMVTEAEVKFYIKQLLEGILYLHKNEILHLDIKPSNILMVHNDRDDIKICDFGFSQKINPFEPQYSTYGSPEFVSPEILSQSPVTTASDIWPVGVICYLSLTCKSPFAGENDQATLLNVQHGVISRDSSDWDHLSKEAKDFISEILQPAPGTRPSALECLSHTWFAHNPSPEDAHFIDTKQLNFFVSRSRWQRSLMSYKSVLVMRPIPEILEKRHKNTSLGISRQLVEESSSSSTSGSSSDNEISVSSGRKPFGPIPELHLSVLEGPDYPEYEEFGAEVKIPEDAVQPAKTTRLKETSAKRQLDGQPVQEREASVYQEPETHGRGLFELASLQDKAGLLLPEEGRMERSPGCVPRHSVIKSTFYSQPSDSLTDVPSSPGKEQRKQLERAKRSYRKAGYSKSALSGLREPLLEQFEFGGEGGSLADTEFGKGREGGSGPLMTKSASFDTAQKSPKVTFQVSTRSRSLDDYRIRATGFAEEQGIAEEDMDLIPQGSLAEVTHLRDGNSSATRTREGFSEEQPMLVIPDDKEGSNLSLQQQEKALVSAQGPEKGEDLLQKQKAPLFEGRSLQGREDLILAAQQTGLAPGLAPKCETEEGQASLSSTHRDTGAIFQKGESSILRGTQSETTSLVSQDSKEEKLSYETKPSSPKSEEGRTPQQEESLPLLKSVPFHITHVQAEKQLAGAPDKSPKGLQTVAVHEGHSPGYPKPLVYPETQTVESRSSSSPVLHTDISASSIPVEKEQQIPSQKPSGLSLAKSAKLEKKDLENLNIPEAQMASSSVSGGAKQKHVHQLPLAHTERKLPGATSVSILPGETQMASLPKPSIYPEGEPLLKEVQRSPQQAETLTSACESRDRGHGKSLKTSEFASVIPKGQRPQVKTDLTSVFEAENQELYHDLPSAPSEVKSAIPKGQTPSLAGFSQAKMAPTSVSESAKQKHFHQLPLAHTERKLPVVKGEGPVHPEMIPMGESQHPSRQESSVYSRPPSSAPGSTASFIQAAFQPGATSVSILPGETQMASLPKPSIYPEGEPLLKEVQHSPQQAETLTSACECRDRGHGKSLKTSEFASVIPKGQGPQVKTDLTSVFEAENQELYHDLPSAPSEVKSAIPKGQTPSLAGFSQAKMAPTSVSESAKQKHFHQLPLAHTERKLPVAKGEGPVHPEMVPMGESQHPSRQESSVYSRPPPSAPGSTASFIQAAFQPGATFVSILPGETQMASLPKPSIYPEGEPLLKEVQRPPQQAETLTSTSESRDWGHGKSLKTSEFAAVIPKGQRPQVKTDLTSVFEAENWELYHHVPSAPSEVKSAIPKGQTPSLAGFSQAKVRPFSTSEERILVTVKKTPYSIGEGRSKEHTMHEKLSLYSDPESQALENLAEEMASLSKATPPLAESVPAAEGSKRHIAPQGEMFYQDSPGQAVRPKGRYLVRRGKREGGIGLADPTEADIIYPGEEDYFSAQSHLSKKGRMSSPYEGQGRDYTGAETSTPSLFDRLSYYAGRQGSNRMYEIALVQIQDLSELPRPDSKTAKFDISEVEPAFLNLHELYDIVYSPFEFLSFRKAPEKLPSKRHLPPGFKLHSQQDKKICLREDNLQGEAIREPFGEGEKGALKVEIGPEPTIAPRIGKRSDSEGDLPVGSQQMYDLPSDPTRKRKSSLQSALGLFKPIVRSQSMEQVEQSLKKRMKASVAHFSRMLSRKLSSEEHREDSEERKSEQAERTSSTEPSPASKKKSVFSSFTLPSLKTKDKGPFFAEELADQTVAIGQSLALSCRTSAHSFSRVEWFKDGAGICSTDRILISPTLKRFQLLTVLSATMEDFGTYTCTATSSHGTVSTSCTIRKAEAPSNPPSPDILEVLEDGVQLAWEPVELNTPVTYSVLCKKDDGEWKTLASDILDCRYTVEHLPRGLVYSFRIACVSPAGVGPYSYPTPKVKIGEQDQAASQDGEDKMTAQATQHQTYAFQTEIKRGRFSIIKQCQEKFSGNPLAAKIIPYRQEEKEVVLQEYQILRKLHHTNIGQLQGAYVSPRHLVLIMELCVGPELLHALAGRSSYSEVQVRDYLWQILSAVEYLHKQDILHLDLRSENMIIVEPNLLKLLDFGNAQFYVPDQIITLDGSADYVETMASELLSDKGAVPQTDIWAIGVTAFIMLSAEYPVSPEAACDFGRLVKRGKIRLNKCYAGLSGGAINFLQSTLSFNPWRRPTATECLQSSWLQETGLDEHQQATVTFSTAKLRNFVAERERKRALLCSKYGVMAV